MIFQCCACSRKTKLDTCPGCSHARCEKCRPWSSKAGGVAPLNPPKPSTSTRRCGSVISLDGWTPSELANAGIKFAYGGMGKPVTLSAKEQGLLDACGGHWGDACITADNGLKLLVG